jgi:hypothetical protein
MNNTGNVSVGPKSFAGVQQNVKNSGNIGSLAASEKVRDVSVTGATGEPGTQKTQKSLRWPGFLLLLAGLLMLSVITVMMMRGFAMPLAAIPWLRLLTCLFLAGGAIAFGDKASSSVEAKPTTDSRITFQIAGYIAAAIGLYLVLWLFRWP